MTRYVLLTAFLLTACGDGGAEIDVSVGYPATADLQDVAALHAWVVTGTEGHEASCNLLVAGAQEPYDVQLRLLGEGGFRSDETLTATVQKQEGIVYVVAFDYMGEPLYAGCSPISGSSVTVTLGLLRMYNCADATTPPGARCDDGNICTVSEHCRSGQCTGTPRDCSQFNGACTVGVCEQNVGCKQVAANEGQACDDGLFCTGNGKCINGGCGPDPAAPPTPCPAPSNPCLQNVCDEQLDRCISLPRPSGTDCDDGNGCNTGDFCDNAGNCRAGPTVRTSISVECDLNACSAGDSCNATGACISGTTPTFASSCDVDRNPCTNGFCSGTTCVLSSYASTTTPCWDGSPCTVGDRCGSFGSCVSGPYNDADYDGDGCTRFSCSSSSCSDCDDGDPNTTSGPELCTDGKDNNCDGIIDETNCVP